MPKTFLGPGGWVKAMLATFTLFQLMLPGSTVRPLYFTCRPCWRRIEPPPNHAPPFRKFGSKSSLTTVGGAVHSGLKTMVFMSAEKIGVA